MGIGKFTMVKWWRGRNWKRVYKIEMMRIKGQLILSLHQSL